MTMSEQKGETVHSNYISIITYVGDIEDISRRSEVFLSEFQEHLEAMLPRHSNVSISSDIQHIVKRLTAYFLVIDLNIFPLMNSDSINLHD